MASRVDGSSWGWTGAGGPELRLRQGRGQGLYEGGIVGCVDARRKEEDRR